MEQGRSTLGSPARHQAGSCRKLVNTYVVGLSELYAAGLDNNSVFCGHYPGGGASIGPAMTFGYVAARHMAGIAES